MKAPNHVPPSQIVTLSQEYLPAARYREALFRLLQKSSQTLQP